MNPKQMKLGGILFLITGAAFLFAAILAQGGPFVPLGGAFIALGGAFVTISQRRG